MKQLLLDIGWADTAALERFVPGREGEVLEAVRLRSEGCAEPLFLHGPPGTGKSHLLRGACREAGRRGSAAYLPMGTLRRHDPAILDGLEAGALVALDGVEQMAGDRPWEEALFHLFNRCRERGTPWMAAGRAPPTGLGLVLPDLASRLGWGPVYALGEPDDATLRTILLQQAARRGVTLDEAVVTYLLTRGPRQAGALLSVFDRLEEQALMARRRITVPLAREVLSSSPLASGVPGGSSAE